MSGKKLKFKHIGEFARAKREAGGFSQKEVALEAGYTPQYLSNVERGVSDPSDDLKIALIKLLKIDHDEWIQAELKIYRSELVSNLGLRATKPTSKWGKNE